MLGIDTCELRFLVLDQLLELAYPVVTRDRSKRDLG